MKYYGVIYKATNIYNLFVYIGQTVKPFYKRKNDHKNSAKRGDGYKFHDAIRYFGWESFSWEILAICYSAYELQDIEAYYINLYQSCILGYNQNSWGNKPDDATRKKLSDFQIGRKKSVEWCRNISLNHADVSGINNPMYGKKFSPAHCLKISTALVDNGSCAGSNNPAAGTYEIIEPDGKEIIVKSLKTYSISKGLNFSSMRAAMQFNRQYHGYRIKRIDVIIDYKH
jgi:group I intron endonuclease